MTKNTAKKRWIGLIVLFTVMIILGIVYAQETGKRPSSYSPVVIQEDFASIMARMKADKPAVMKKHMDLINQRYDLGTDRLRG